MEFRYVLNAFLSAARAGHAFLRAAEKPLYERWESGLPLHDREILFAARKARDLGVHEDGPTISSGEAFSYVPTPGSYVHTFHLERADGSRVVVPAVGTCSRYLGLLVQALGGYQG